ncbi:predicted protein [Chaetoceros tenuissimus]|uniref:Uncharacterized protein n=1 Tax=Chaetoceros tenuissimus TaxID=426638 RepID=A0AAD3D2F3_9STRA|nr:predicted protein [Chaetoceros tenuissimus]
MIFLFMTPCLAASPCSCSPLTYEWTLDFKAGGCPDPETLNQVDGITNSSMCQIYTTTDGDPVQIDELRFFEYGAGLHDLVNYRVLRGKWNDTDTMSVSSITSEDPTIFTSSATIELAGTKEDGSSFLFIWLADYTNACNVEPYDGIDSIAYLNFTNARMNPSPSTCDPSQSSLPSLTPSSLPSSSPSSLPSLSKKSKSSKKSSKSKNRPSKSKKSTKEKGHLRK